MHLLFDESYAKLKYYELIHENKLSIAHSLQLMLPHNYYGISSTAPLHLLLKDTNSYSFHINSQNVLHIKGYGSKIEFDYVASRLDKSSQRRPTKMVSRHMYEIRSEFDLLKRIVHKIVNIIITNDMKVLTWDGDPYNEKSFTAAIPLVLNQLEMQTGGKYKIDLIAFRCKNEGESCLKSWISVLKNCNYHRFIVFETPCENFLDLGVYAIQTTRATKIVSIGGGECVVNEIDKLKVNEIGIKYEVHVIPVYRSTIKETDLSEILIEKENGHVNIFYEYCVE